MTMEDGVFVSSNLGQREKRELLVVFGVLRETPQQSLTAAACLGAEIPQQGIVRVQIALTDEIALKLDVIVGRYEATDIELEKLMVRIVRWMAALEPK